jgi:hypothetical protein
MLDQRDKAEIQAAVDKSGQVNTNGTALVDLHARCHSGRAAGALAIIANLFTYKRENGYQQIAKAKHTQDAKHQDKSQTFILLFNRRWGFFLHDDVYLT